jgi:FlaG/FlaF family flagellin (archaellin)
MAVRVIMTVRVIMAVRVIMTGLILAVLSGPGDLHLAPRNSASTSIAHNNINLFNQQ